MAEDDVPRESTYNYRMILCDHNAAKRGYQTLMHDQDIPQAMRESSARAHAAHAAHCCVERDLRRSCNVIHGKRGKKGNYRRLFERHDRSRTRAPQESYVSASQGREGQDMIDYLEARCDVRQREIQALEAKAVTQAMEIKALEAQVAALHAHNVYLERRQVTDAWIRSLLLSLARGQPLTSLARRRVKRGR